MSNPIQSRLSPIRSRQRALSALDGFFRGLAIGAGIAVFLEIARRSTGNSQPLWLTAAAILPLPLSAFLGAILYAFKTPSDKNAAAAIDARYNLKDRTITALELASLKDPSPIQSLALADAQTHLTQIDPRQVIPLVLPRNARWAALLAAVVLLLAALPSPNHPQGSVTPPQITQNIQKETQKLIEELKKAQEDIKKQDNPQLQNLAKDLQKLAQELKEAAPAPREALAKLSEMQAAIRQEQAKFNTSLAQEHLKSLGQALAANPTTSQAGKALQEGKNQEAAKALDEKTTLPPSAADRNKLARDLKEAADKMQEAGLQDLAQATQKLSDAAQQNNASDFSQGAQSLGKLTRQQDQQKKNDEWMKNQLARLDEAKQNTSNEETKSQEKSDQGQGQPAPGDQQGQGDQQAQGKASTEGEGQKSGESQGQKSSKTDQWGTGEGGDPLGDPTKIDAKRQQEQLTGKLGQSGDSESQTTHTSQGSDKSKASYRDTHQRYQKLSESVLETEPLPLGQRQTIRKYFEAIRPSDTEK